MKGLFIPGITVEMFRNGSLESVAELMADGEIYDIDYQEPCKEQEPILDKIKAEIERKAHSGQWSNSTKYGMLKAVAIIDKYRVESEG